MRKLRILWCGEATYLKTGYGVYGHEVLKRLHATGKYEIAEFAAYGRPDAAERFDIPWRYYGNLPANPADRSQSALQFAQNEHNEYRSNTINEFGAWRFEDVCLDFKPDIVWDIRDWWMHEYQCRSPFRRLFHWVVMPTVDSAPQQRQYIDSYCQADGVFAYSEFGKKVLEEQSSNFINVLDICSPGADMSIFKPIMDKKKHRESYGFQSDVKIIGTIMRNQKRKLYPDLLASFKKFIQKEPSLAKNVFLYLHVAHPDIGWDIPELIKESGLGNKVLLTYICRHCKTMFPSFLQDARMVCSNCRRPEAMLPTPEHSVSSEQLSHILNFFDVYVQYSICEGFGMPQIEAASCAVPVMAVDYSAMSSVMKNIKGIPIKVLHLAKECESGAYRAIPDNDDLVDRWIKFFTAPDRERVKRGLETYRLAKSIYTWERTAKKWEKYFDSLELESKWDLPPRIFEAARDVPNNLADDDFVRWGINNVLGEPEKIDSYLAMRMIRDLNYRQYVDGAGGSYANEDSAHEGRKMNKVFNRNEALRKLYEMGEFRNYWESVRAGIIHRDKPEFILNAKPSETESEIAV